MSTNGKSMSEAINGFDGTGVLETIRYCGLGVPRKVPAGRLVCHNPVLAVVSDQPMGAHGFRPFTISESESDQVVECGCGWNPKLGKHYTREAAWTARGHGVPQGRTIPTRKEWFDAHPEATAIEVWALP